jgi:hypothetical protein
MQNKEAMETQKYLGKDLKIYEMASIDDQISDTNRTEAAHSPLNKNDSNLEMRKGSFLVPANAA